MRKVKALLKGVNKDLEIIEIEENTLKDVHEIYGVKNIGHAGLGNNLYCYFEDFGWKLFKEGSLEYNCDLPSCGEIKNRIFGNMVITKVNEEGSDIDVSEQDIQFISEKIFVDNEFKTKKNKKVDKMVTCLVVKVSDSKNPKFLGDDEELLKYIQEKYENLLVETNVWGKLLIKKISDDEYRIVDGDETILCFKVLQRHY